MTLQIGLNKGYHRMREDLTLLKNQLTAECIAILDWWMKFATDSAGEGFHGAVNNLNISLSNAPKGAVLNCRILWTFSAAYNHFKDPAYLQIAHKAYAYIVDHFIDGEFGGVYWSVDADGKPLNTKKQVYAIAFAIYGLSEYVLACGDEQAAGQAVALYNTIEQHAHDTNYGGYFEAFSKEWNDLSDLRLSDKDFNEKKSMNTHLHVLEAYTNLYRIYPNVKLKTQIERLIDLFLRHIINPVNHHLILFFNEQWTPKSETISYGHDIEAAWLLQEAAEVIDNAVLLAAVKERGAGIARAAAKGLDTDGGLWYEKSVKDDHLVKEKHWWPQAEAMVGFFNAWQVTAEPHFLQKSKNAWGFIQRHLLDRKHGEWFWGVKEDYSIMQGEDKAGLWKCPYHNGRACMEMIKRIAVNSEYEW